MKKENILDIENIRREEPIIMEIVNWWEKKRLIYNIIIIVLELIMLSMYWEIVEAYSTAHAILGSIVYTIGANVFFSIGWGIEILSLYYFKTTDFLEKTRVLFLVLGIIVSIILTIGVYMDVFYFYQI